MIAAQRRRAEIPMMTHHVMTRRDPRQPLWPPVCGGGVCLPHISAEPTGPNNAEWGGKLLLFAKRASHAIYCLLIDHICCQAPAPRTRLRCTHRVAGEYEGRALGLNLTQTDLWDIDHHHPGPRDQSKRFRVGAEANGLSECLHSQGIVLQGDHLLSIIRI